MTSFGNFTLGAWQLTGQSWLPDCAPVAEALFSVSWGTPRLLPGRVSVSAAFSASWGATAAKRGSPVKIWLKNCPCSQLTFWFWRLPSTPLAASLAGSSPAFSFQVFGQGRLCPKAGQDAVCLSILLPWDILQICSICLLGFQCQSLSDDGTVGKDKYGGDGVSRGMIISLSYGERMGRERRKRAGLPHVCAWM